MADAPSLPSVDVAGACELDGEALEGGIEAPRKPRTDKQREAFLKCREALNRKHESAKKKTPEPIHEEPETPEPKVEQKPPETKPTRRTRTVLHIHDYPPIPKPEPPPKPPRKRAPPRPKPATYDPPPQPLYFHVV